MAAARSGGLVSLGSTVRPRKARWRVPVAKSEMSNVWSAVSGVKFWKFQTRGEDVDRYVPSVELPFVLTNALNSSPHGGDAHPLVVPGGEPPSCPDGGWHSWAWEWVQEVATVVLGWDKGRVVGLTWFPKAGALRFGDLGNWRDPEGTYIGVAYLSSAARVLLTMGHVWQDSPGTSGVRGRSVVVRSLIICSSFVTDAYLRRRCRSFAGEFLGMLSDQEDEVFGEVWWGSGVLAIDFSGLQVGGEEVKASSF
ncbi:hypothetical protein BC829DRAFT_449108 [Chytridium lagenaria]|nr:hypothetical protein BC829DRAFT_449108 [Chytridium lagenaria]